MFAQGASAADVQVLHSGRLLSAAGQPIDGAVDLDVALFSSASGGSPVFDDLFDDLSIQDGYYSVTLGAARQLPERRRRRGLGGRRVRQPQLLLGPRRRGRRVRLRPPVAGDELDAHSGCEPAARRDHQPEVPRVRAWLGRQPQPVHGRHGRVRPDQPVRSTG
jgi:hypothetical protein